jgi:hypothetical protein
MRNLPFAGKVIKNIDKEVSVNVVTFKANTLQNPQGISPNLLSESVSLEYPRLSLNEIAFIEEVLDSTKGAERLLWDNKRWRLDSYESNYTFPCKLTLTLIKVG